MRILGVDPGSRVTGYGLIDENRGLITYVSSGCIKTEGNVFSSRLAEIYRGIESLIDEFSPSEVAIEDIFVARNPQSALKLGQARGAAIAAVVAREMPVAEYAARRVKKAVVGTGRATKEQVQQMVKTLLALSAIPSADAADALAVALCHVHTRRAR